MFAKEKIKILIFMIIVVIVTEVYAGCNEEEWECDNGDCVFFDEQCDGQVHCKDQSDEIARNCMHKQCPPYAFRCAYGACIRKDLTCDGNSDCADKSDELEVLCGDSNANEIKLRGACNELQMECFPGSCIDLDRKCDGIVDCVNGADETVEVCGLRKCPAYAFQCGYGACVYAGAYCNGTQECLDGSDESYGLCGYTRISNFIDDDKEEYVDQTVTFPTRISIPKLPPIGNSSWCGIPTDYPHLLIRNFLGKIIEGGIKKDTAVFYACSDGYELVNSKLTSSFCEGPNLHKIPSCEKRCNTSRIKRDFTKWAKCHFETNTYDCAEEERVRAGTEAIFQCASYFSPNSKTWRQHCLEKGEWSESKQDCSMQCGTTVETFPLSANAIDVANTEIPWHVGIYVSANQMTYNYTCGGTIISPIIVITAAHCVYDVTSREAKKAEDFQIIASKLFKDYYRKESGSQIVNVSKIIMHNDYNHFDLYQNDLALLVLEKHLIFGRAVRPLCYDHSIHMLDSGSGKLGAWGASDNFKNNPYEVLQVIIGEHFEYEKCMELKQNEVLTSEKFCVRSDNGLACRGDSGGGYFVYNPKTNLFYLKGVLSSAGTTDAIGCAYMDTNLYLIDVFKFKDWINMWRKIEERNYIVEEKQDLEDVLVNKDFIFREKPDEPTDYNLTVKFG